MTLEQELVKMLELLRAEEVYHGKHNREAANEWDAGRARLSRRFARQLDAILRRHGIIDDGNNEEKGERHADATHDPF